MFSILGGKEIGDGCGIDAGNLSPRKRRDGSALVTFIPFGPGASVENPGCGVIQCGLEIIVGEIFPENFNILVRGVCHGVGKKALRKSQGLLLEFQTRRCALRRPEVPRSKSSLLSLRDQALIAD